MEHIVHLLVSLFVTISMSMGSWWGLPPVTPLDTQGINGTTTAYVVAVIDGDTIEVVIGSTTVRTKVRYIGIDTPEPYAAKLPECGSAEASRRNRELVENKTVTIVPGPDSRDDYGRLLAYVYVDSMFVNKVLVEEGYASVMMFEPNTEYKNTFINLYTNARTQQFGIWGLCG